MKSRLTKPGNIFASIPETLDEELFDLLAQNNNVKIERIVSKGHISPKSGWYDLGHIEWVMLVKGEAKLALENREEIHLKAGSYLNIPAHTKHKVTWTKPNIETVWLAVHCK